jgi:hypothetical protein
VKAIERLRSNEETESDRESQPLRRELAATKALENSVVRLPDTGEIHD